MSGQKLVQLQMTKYAFKPFTIVQPPPNNTRTIIIASITVCCSAFLLTMALIGGCLFFRAGNHSSANMQKLDSITGRSDDGESGFGYFGKAELHGESDITELDHDPDCRLLHQLQLIRRYELRAPIPDELDGSLCRCELATGANMRYEMATEANIRPELDDGKSLPERSESRHSLASAQGEKGKGSEKRPPRPASVESSASSSMNKVAGSKEVMQKQLPIWSWAVLKREKLEQDEQKGKQKEQDDDFDIVSPLSPS